MSDLEAAVGRAVRAATLVKKVTIGLGFFDPAHPYHGAYRPCPHCGEIYRPHGGFADHRDRCEDNPINRDHPERLTDGGEDSEYGFDFGADRPGVPADEGESWGELAERMRPDVVVEQSCPNGHFELEIAASHATVDGWEFLEEVALQDEPGPCPECGAEIIPEVVGETMSSPGGAGDAK